MTNFEEPFDMSMKAVKYRLDFRRCTVIVTFGSRKAYELVDGDYNKQTFLEEDLIKVLKDNTIHVTNLLLEDNKIVPDELDMPIIREDKERERMKSAAAQRAEQRWKETHNGKDNM